MHSLLMACPYFMPTARCAELWPHPSRLPLGGSWTGHCTAPGHEGAVPNDEELKSGCNLGYARCARLPSDREADAVRFSQRECGGRTVVQFVFEIGHLPAAGGTLEYDARQGRWIAAHPDARVQRMAECFLEAKRQARAAAAHS